MTYTLCPFCGARVELEGHEYVECACGAQQDNEGGDEEILWSKRLISIICEESEE